MRRVKKMLLVLVCVALVYVVIACAMIAFPPPESLPMLDSIAAPFRTVDFSGVPELKRFTARDGSALAYREYGSGSRVVVLVHGSSGNSLSMHPLAQGLAARGLKVYSLDIRGHGGSGEKGQIGYVGQLENDMDDFCSTVLEGREAVLAGFSLGGGFVLRYAAQGRQDHFSRYVLLSPYMGSKSPSVKPLSNRWAAVSMPRIIGTVMLGPLGGKLFGHLPVITYGVDPSMARQQTAQYSFNLLRNMSPHDDFRKDIASLEKPLTVICGAEDELHDVSAFKPLFDANRKGTKVVIVPGLSHIMLTTNQAGIAAIADEMAR